MATPRLLKHTLGMKWLVPLSMMLVSASTYSEIPRVESKFIPWADMFQERLYEYFPKEIAQFLDKYRECVHWAGEEAYNAERAKQIETGTKGCDNLDQKRKTLEKQFTGNRKLAEMKQMIGEIDKGSSDYSFIWNDPKKESKALNRYIESQAEFVLKSVKPIMAEYDAELKKGATDEDQKMVIYRLGVQWKIFQDVLREAARLQPDTKRKIDKLSKDRKFQKFAEKAKP